MIDTGAGVIDADYRGVVFVLLFNLSDVDFQGMHHCSSLLSVCLYLTFVLVVEEGDRVAQLIIEKIHTPEVEEVQVSRSSYSIVSFVLMRPTFCRIWTRRFAVQAASGRLVATVLFELC